MTREKRIGLLVLALVILVGMDTFRKTIDKIRYSEGSGLATTDILQNKTDKETNMLIDQSFQFFGAAAVGLREAVASALWVRTDEFFHSGNYQAVMPLVRLVTWLDPNRTDVYITGAWHLDYNFVDKEQRSDRRYIPPAIKLMEDGCKNNPDDYELYFDLAWTHYFQKIKDYKGAAKWMEIAITKPSKDPNTGAIIRRPLFVRRMLAHAYERAGELDKAEKVWLDAVAEAEKYEAEDKKNKVKHEVLVASDVLVTRRNYAMMLLRRAWRYADMDAFARGLKEMDAIENKDPDLVRALALAKSKYEELKSRAYVKPDVLPMIDPGFEITWKKVKPRVLVLEGKLALVPAEDYKDMVSECFTKWYTMNQGMPVKRQVKWRDGVRLRIMLADEDYDYRSLKIPETFSWEVDKFQTIMMDDVMVRDGKFQVTINMSGNPEIYTFSKDKYRLLVWINPGDMPDYMQDRIGWRGEGLMDKPYIDKKMIPGSKFILKEFILTKRDII